MTEKTRLYSIDALKALAAFFVCYQHAYGTGFFSDYVLSIAKVAVPIFIIITGYMYEDTKKRKHEPVQIKRYFLIALEMGAFWFILDTVYHFAKHDLSVYLHQFIEPSLIMRFIFFNDPMAADHAWYMWALLYVLIFMLALPSLLDNEKLQNVLIITGCFALLFMGRYSRLVLGADFPYYYIRNFACEGIPFFLIGYKIRKIDDENRLPKIHNCVLLLGLSSLLQLVEHGVLHRAGLGGESGTYFMTPAIAFCLVALAVKLKDKVSSKNLLARIGLKYSLFIYVVHPVFVRVEKRIVAMDSLWQYAGVLAVIIASLLCAVIYDRTLKRTRLFRHVF